MAQRKLNPKLRAAFATRFGKRELLSGIGGSSGSEANLGKWSELEIGEQQGVMYLPEGGPPYDRAAIYLPGFTESPIIENRRLMEELERRRLPVMAPVTEHNWWLDVECEPFSRLQTSIEFVLNELTSQVERQFGVKPPHVGICGADFGGQGALQVAYRWARRFPVVAAICPAIDFHDWHGHGSLLDEMFDNAEAARQHTAILQIHPLNWPKYQLLMCDPYDEHWLEGTVRLISKLGSSGILYDSDLESTARGDRRAYIERVLPKAMGYLAEKLALQTAEMLPTARDGNGPQ